MIVDDSKLVDLYEGNGSNEGGFIAPAVVLYFLESKANARTTQAVIQTVADVASLAIPDAGAYKLITYADKVSSVMSIAGSYYQGDDPELAKYLNITSSILGLTSFTFDLTTANSFRTINNTDAAIAKLNQNGANFNQYMNMNQSDNVLALKNRIDKAVNSPSSNLSQAQLLERAADRDLLSSPTGKNLLITTLENEITDGEEYHAFMNTLLELTMVYNQTNPNITIDFGQFENNKVMRSTDHEAINRFKFELQQSNTQGLYYTLLNSVSPETLVTIDLTTDIKLANLSYFYEDFVGDQITVPAFYLYYMEDQRMTANLTKAVMVLLDLAVIVGSAGTATPYAIASIALSGSNIIVTLNEDAIAGLNGGQDFLNVWSLVQVVDGVNGLAQIGKGIGKKLSGGSLQLFFSLDNLSAGLAQVKTSSAYLEAAESLAKVRRLWYFMQFSGENVIANMMKSKLMMKLEAKVLKKNFVKIDPSVDLEVANLYNVKILEGSNSKNVLTMNPNSEGAFLSGNIVDDIPDNSLVVARFDDARFNSGSPSIQEGDLVVYKKTNGEFVVVSGTSNQISHKSIEELYSQFNSFIGNKGLKHIFRGEVNSVGNASGVHHISAINAGTARIVPGSIEPLIDGFYKASVEVLDNNGNWITKTTDKSTFFPDTWDEVKVMQEIQSASNNKIGVNITDTPTKLEYYGVSNSGHRIRIIIDPRYGNSPGNILTCWFEPL